jgi:hypothetical protein
VRIYLNMQRGITDYKPITEATKGRKPSSAYSNIRETKKHSAINLAELVTSQGFGCTYKSAHNLCCLARLFNYLMPESNIHSLYKENYVDIRPIGSHI